jgi:hypothetical protein
VAALTVRTITRTGSQPTTYWEAAAAGGDTFASTGSEFVMALNGSAGASTVTIVTTETKDGLAVADRTVVVGAGETWMFGPFAPHTYGRTVSLTYSASAGLYVASYRLTPEPY